MPTFHFSVDPPAQQTFTDFQNLNAFSDSQLETFIDIILNYLTSDATTSGDLLESVGQFAGSNGMALGTLKSTVNSLLNFFKAATRSNLVPQHVKEDAVNLGTAEDKATKIAAKYKSKFIQISRTMIGQTLNVNQLVDLDWNFGITAASSEVGKIGSAHLHLKLVLDKGNSTTEEVYMELTLQQFYQFLHEMQRAKSNLEFFTTG